jgi:hypothetical protein
MLLPLDALDATVSPRIIRRCSSNLTDHPQGSGDANRAEGTYKPQDGFRRPRPLVLRGLQLRDIRHGTLYLLLEPLKLRVLLVHRFFEPDKARLDVLPRVRHILVVWGRGWNNSVRRFHGTRIPERGPVSHGKLTA